MRPFPAITVIALGVALLTPSWADDIEDDPQYQALRKDYQRQELHVKHLEREREGLIAIRDELIRLQEKNAELVDRIAELEALVELYKEKHPEIVDEVEREQSGAAARVHSSIDPQVMNADTLQTLATLNIALQKAYAETTSLRKAEALSTIKLAAPQLFKDQRILIQGALRDVGKNDNGHIVITIDLSMAFEYPVDGEKVLDVAVYDQYVVHATAAQAATMQPGDLVSIGISSPEFVHGFSSADYGTFARLSGGDAFRGFLVAKRYKLRIGDATYTSRPR